MRRNRQRRTTGARRERGQALIESALVITTVLCMILFILDIGRLLFYQQYFTERARVGARWASVNAYDATAIRNVVAYNSTTGSGAGYFGLNPTSNVSVSQAGSNPQYVTVTIQNFQTLTLIPYIAGNYTLPPISATMPVHSGGATN